MLYDDDDYYKEKHRCSSNYWRKKQVCVVWCVYNVCKYDDPECYRFVQLKTAKVFPEIMYNV